MAAWVGVRGWLASRELQAAAPQALVAQKAIASGDVAAASAAAHRLAAHAASAASLTSDPVWRATEVLPWVGDNLRAVRVLSSSLNDAADGAIVPLVDLFSTLGVDSLRPQTGAIDWKPLATAQPAADRAQAAMARARSAVDALDQSDLIGPIDDARSKLATQFAAASEIADGLDTTLKILPTMLGSDGPRNYLVLFQNNAELRTSGGVPGASALIHADNGAISLARQAGTADFPPDLNPPLSVQPETAAIYGDIVGTHVQNVVMSPDFAQTGALASAVWTRQFGDVVDGVVSIDPVALSYLLKATGPVAMPEQGELTSANVVSKLLVDTYSRWTKNADQNAYFDLAARNIFAALMGGKADPSTLYRALDHGAREHRISVWSAHPEIQAEIARTSLAGLSAAQGALGAQAYGIYFNDTSGGKMDVYLKTTVAIRTERARSDGLVDVALQITIANTAPADAATSLPSQVTGGGAFGTPAAWLGINAAVYGAEGGFDNGVTEGAGRIPYLAATDQGHPVQSVHYSVAPGQALSRIFHFVSANRGQDSPVFVHTPMVNEVAVTGN